MAGNPFFSGRIPQDLHDRIQQHCETTGESKTQVLINALAAYLNHPLKLENPSSTGISHQEFAALQEQVAALEKSIQTSNLSVITHDNREIGLIKEKIELLVTRQNQVDILLANLPLKLMEFEEQIKTLSSVNIPDNTDNGVDNGVDNKLNSDPLDDSSTDGIDELVLNHVKSLSPSKPLTQTELAKRLNCHKSVVSRHKLLSDFEEWSKGHDPDAIAWRYDREKKVFVPV